MCIYLFFRNVQVYTDINTKTNKIFYSLKHTFAIMFHYVETMLENYCLSFSTGLQAMLYQYQLLFLLHVFIACKNKSHLEIKRIYCFKIVETCVFQTEQLDMTSCILSSQYCIDYMCPANTVLIIWNIQTFICLVVVMGDFYLTLMLLGNMYSSYLNFWLRPETSVFAGYFEHFRFG